MRCVSERAMTAQPDPSGLWQALEPLRSRLADTLARLDSVFQDLWRGHPST